MERRAVLRMLATGTALQLAPRNILVMLREARALLGTQAVPRTLNAHQNATVRTMAEAILPRTDTPGATDVGVAEFIDLMLTEWYNEAERYMFFNGLADVDSRSKALFNKDFIDCSPLQQSDILIALGEKMVEDGQHDQPSNDDQPAPDPSFYSMFRRLTLTAYYTSEAGATDELHFQIIPDQYKGCDVAPAIKEAQDRQ
ncbi:MAG: gluconate 2-dehydrogenase subunit 3 family protein [Terriglobales bacterium]